MENKKILHISFNQGGSHFALGTESGFKVFKSSPLELKCDKSIT